MSVRNPYQSYQQNAINTASPGELTLMLYNGCLKFIHVAKTAIAEKNIEMKNTNIQKAQKIIQELMVTLNPELEVSKSMMPLYDYVYRRLVEANIKSDVAILEEVEEFVTDFRDTWKQVIQINRQKQYAEGGQV
ncbi:flagellar export chaperone FliS [Neobacillus sp. PS3-12]|uniref:flagellar export chaperone FliS n=1 Tax=Neobacillus sp. PS3-12 TaxID=3070677 RepID=UPI0027E150FF|nr:flagellar export chaperone FliS [Neobacillus sp. PS3-12]WML54739.1 flagellar export chaperone FliS [Neobacillus sp. PS3-12]